MKPVPSRVTNYGARQHQETLLSMRKHRSLDGSQFLSQHLDPASNAYPVVSGASGMSEFGPMIRRTCSTLIIPPAQHFPSLNTSLIGRIQEEQAYCGGGGPYGLEAENEMLKRELSATEQKLNYVMNTIQNFWSPELKKERQLRKEEAMRSNQMQYKTDLQNCEVRLKCAEEQRAELEKRNDILTRTNVANESQLKLLQDDLNVLRKKLETKNQLLESKEKTLKGLEKELDLARNQIQELQQNRQENEHRSSNLTHRIEQLETLLRERDAQLDRTKQRLLQQPGNRLEKELQLRAENAEHDKNNLEKLVENLKQNTELDKQNQLQNFQEESRHLHKTIDYLQKELTDRTMLIASQNEKISQLDTQSKTLLDLEDKSRHDSTAQNVENLKAELDETRKEVERLLRIVQNLEKEKTQLTLRWNENNKLNNITSNGLNEVSLRSTKLTELTLCKDEDGGALRIRVGELEEALRESQLIQQLSTQVNELYKVSETLQKMLEEERSKFQRQLTNLRKEVGMELIKEKDACINLLQSPPDSLKEKVEILTRQKEQLKHRLLIQVNDAFSTSEGGPYLGNAWQNLGKTSVSSLELAPTLYQQRPNFFSTVVGSTNMATSTTNAHLYSNIDPINVAVPLSGVGVSAPASLLHYGRDDAEDDGIWA
uniref:Uncharacterized protein n=1 Tax=Ditylenchus dipsaci TaxID=166011 RepID=A0A915E748_9BILA